MDFEIRQAKKEDYNALCRLFRQGDSLHHQALPNIFSNPDPPVRSKEFIFSLLADEKAAVFVVEFREEVIGLISIKISAAPEIPILEERQYAEIDSIVVDKEYRGNKVGKALMKRGHQWVVDNGVKEVELNVHKFNQEAISFYKSLGYSVRSQKMSKKLKESNLSKKDN